MHLDILVRIRSPPKHIIVKIETITRETFMLLFAYFKEKCYICTRKTKEQLKAL